MNSHSSEQQLDGHKYYGILGAAVATVVLISDFVEGEFLPFGDKCFWKKKKKENFVFNTVN
jgi:hypothetical protein